MKFRRRIKVALLDIDRRETLRKYDLERPIFGTAQTALIQGLAELKDVEVHLVSCIQEPAQAEHQLAENIRSYSLYVPKIGWMRTLYQGCVRSVRRKLREIQPDVVHGQGTERDCALSAVLSGFPNVLTIHGNMRRVAAAKKARPFTFYWIAALLETFAVRRTNGIICISEYTRRLVNHETKRTWLVPNAVDPSFFDVARQFSSECRLLVPATICNHKNQNQLIRALDPLALNFRFRLDFVGDYVNGDPYAKEFFELISVRPWCSFGGYASRDDLKKALSFCSAMILPSIEDNCPMVILEAAAAGVSTIGSRIGGIPGLITEDETGLLFNPTDVESIRHAVERILKLPELGLRLGRNARKKAQELHMPLQIAGRHLEIYREIASPRS